MPWRRCASTDPSGAHGSPCAVCSVAIPGAEAATTPYLKHNIYGSAPCLSRRPPPNLPEGRLPSLQHPLPLGGGGGGSPSDAARGYFGDPLQNLPEGRLPSLQHPLPLGGDGGGSPSEAPRAYFGDPLQTSPRGGFLRCNIHSPSGETEGGRLRKRPVLISEAPRAYFGSASRLFRKTCAALT